MTWTAPEIDRSPKPPLAPERAALEGFLEFHRDTLLHKCEGLNEEQLRRTPAEPSTLSLLGLVQHLTEVEYGWFGESLKGMKPEELPYNGGAEDPAEVFERYGEAVRFARSAAAGHELDDTFDDPYSGTVDVRWLYLHMIEEYARHNGHADLIREAIDGATGE